MDTNKKIGEDSASRNRSPFAHTSTTQSTFIAFDIEEFSERRSSSDNRVHVYSSKDINAYFLF